MRLPVTPLVALVLITSMLYSYVPESIGVTPYGDDMLVGTVDKIDTKSELDVLEQEAWHFAEDAHILSKLQCWTSCVWKKFSNLFGADQLVPENCSWGTCPGTGTTE